MPPVGGCTCTCSRVLWQHALASMCPSELSPAATSVATFPAPDRSAVLSLPPLGVQLRLLLHHGQALRGAMVGTMTATATIAGRSLGQSSLREGGGAAVTGACRRVHADGCMQGYSPVSTQPSYGPGWSLPRAPPPRRPRPPSKVPPRQQPPRVRCCRVCPCL